MTPCLHGKGIVVCTPTYTDMRLIVRLCPTCGRQRRMLAKFQDWYGWDSTCLTCGDEWADGEMRQRPDGRLWENRQGAWRKRRVQEAWARYRRWKAGAK